MMLEYIPMLAMIPILAFVFLYDRRLHKDLKEKRTSMRKTISYCEMAVKNRNKSQGEENAKGV